MLAHAADTSEADRPSIRTSLSAAYTVMGSASTGSYPRNQPTFSNRHSEQRRLSKLHGSMRQGSGQLQAQPSVTPPTPSTMIGSRDSQGSLGGNVGSGGNAGSSADAIVPLANGTGSHVLGR